MSVMVAKMRNGICVQILNNDKIQRIKASFTEMKGGGSVKGGVPAKHCPQSECPT